jgi:hypothetical protein
MVILPRHDGLSSSDSKSPAPVLRRSRMTETQAMPQSRFERRWKSDGKMWKKWLKWEYPWKCCWKSMGFHYSNHGISPETKWS